MIIRCSSSCVQVLLSLGVMAFLVCDAYMHKRTYLLVGDERVALSALLDSTRDGTSYA